MDLDTFLRRKGRIHFIGCAGVGTQPLAMILHDLGFECSGSDLLETVQTKQLEGHGIRVFRGHAKEHLPPEDGRPLLVIYTSASAPDNPERTEACRQGAECMRRGEALAYLAPIFPVTIAVAGSHGKTSVTSMITHLLKALGKDPGFLIGGSVHSWDRSGSAGGRKYFVTEVDESDSTNALFHATLGVITNIEDDHAWSVGGTAALFESFHAFAEKAEKIVYVQGTNTSEVLSDFKQKSTILNKDPELPPTFFPPHWGGFMKTNAQTAIRAVETLFPGEFSEEKLWKLMADFPGVERRMSLRFQNKNVKIIEDYAHHPTELRASLSALRETNPSRRLVVLFQPHRFARLKRYFEEFAEVLSSADRVFLAPVFAAWTDRSDVDSKTLALRIGSKAVALEGTWAEIAKKITDEIQPNDLLAVIGAGDLKDILPPLIEGLKKK